ncbi:MAG: glycosyltransferase family 2 protein [Bacteroidales bacterium]|nr:glycosyltransferase family 2 protein [Bacteroidales bacterium]
MNNNIKLSIIIINYKTPVLTLQCISSIYEFCDLKETEIIFVDNNSQDNSVELIKENFPEVKMYENEGNEGFGRANNKGFSVSSGKYILLLNSDILLTSAETIPKCINILESDVKIGALGCKLINEDGSHQNSVNYYTTEYSGILRKNLFIDKLYKFSQKTKIKALMGAFFLIPRKVFEETNGFDPDFFMYCEEIEFCDRIIKKGYSLFYYDEVSVIHKNEGSSTDSKWVIRQKNLSSYLFLWKQKGIFHYYINISFNIFNTITNFCLMLFLDKNYRKDFFYSTYNFYSTFARYLLIPFRYSRKTGNGRKMLKY